MGGIADYRGSLRGIADHTGQLWGESRPYMDKYGKSLGGRGQAVLQQMAQFDGAQPQVTSYCWEISHCESSRAWIRSTIISAARANAAGYKTG